jgi:hypothetical protein
VEPFATNASSRGRSEVCATVARARRFPGVPGISSWPSMPRHSYSPRVRRALSIRESTRGRRLDISATFAEFILLPAQIARRALSSSRLARSMIPVSSKVHASSLGRLRCRSFICCRPMCQHMPRFLDQRRHRKMANKSPEPTPRLGVMRALFRRAKHTGNLRGVAHL